MMLFDPRAKHRSHTTGRLYALYEIVYTCVDFSAALAFIVGSVMFFWQSWLFAGTWMFVIGSVLFAVKPSIRLVREIHLYRQGESEQVAERLAGET